MKIFRPNGDFQTNTGNSDAIVASYKKLIKQQDDEIASLKQQLDQLKLAQVNGTAKTDEQDEVWELVDIVRFLIVFFAMIEILI